MAQLVALGRPSASALHGKGGMAWNGDLRRLRWSICEWGEGVQRWNTSWVTGTLLDRRSPQGQGDGTLWRGSCYSCATETLTFGCACIRSLGDMEQ